MTPSRPYEVTLGPDGEAAERASSMVDMTVSQWLRRLVRLELRRLRTAGVELPELDETQDEVPVEPSEGLPENETRDS